MKSKNGETTTDSKNGRSTGECKESEIDSHLSCQSTILTDSDSDIDSDSYSYSNSEECEDDAKSEWEDTVHEYNSDSKEENYLELDRELKDNVDTE